MREDARRHELRHADRAGIAAAPDERIDAFLIREDEQALQLVAKEPAAVAAAAREVEGERRQRIERAKGPRLLAVEGLDAHDADDDLRRHAVLRFRALQPFLVRIPEPDAGC